MIKQSDGRCRVRVHDLQGRSIITQMIDRGFFLFTDKIGNVTMFLEIRRAGKRAVTDLRRMVFQWVEAIPAKLDNSTGYRHGSRGRVTVRSERTGGTTGSAREPQKAGKAV